MLPSQLNNCENRVMWVCGYSSNDFRLRAQLNIKPTRVVVENIKYEAGKIVEVTFRRLGVNSKLLDRAFIWPGKRYKELKAFDTEKECREAYCKEIEECIELFEVQYE